MDLTPTEEEVLRDLRPRSVGGNGDNIQTNIAENIDRSERGVSNAIDSLEDKEAIENKGRKVYRLTEKGREAADSLGEIENTLKHLR